MEFSYFDAHCDTLSACLETGAHLRQNPGQADLTRGAALGGYAQTFAMFADPDELGRDGARLLRRLTRLHDFFAAELQANADRMALCRTAAQVRGALAQHKTAALLSIEGADLLDCDPARLPEAAGWGVRFVNLTWNCANRLSGTNVEDPGRGLSDAGRAFVGALERLGMAPDVSHLSDPGFWDVLRCAHGPVIATHSCSRAVHPHPRNLTDDQFRAIRDSGGMVGINFYAEFVGPDGGGAEQLLRHIERFLTLDGEDALGLGGDLDGCAPLCAGMRGLQDIPALHESLRSALGDTLTEKLFFGNWMSLLERLPEGAVR